LFLVVLAVVSFLWFGYLNDIVVKLMEKEYKPNPNLIEYNGYVFTKEGSLWFFDFEKDGNTYDVPVYYNPKEVESISMDENISFSSIYSKNMYYISLDESVTPRSLLAGVEIAKVWGQAEYGILKMQVKSALAYESESSPYITCENATSNVGVIFLTLSNETKIKKEGDCIILAAQNENEMMMLADKLIYISLGIMK
jgi:hypothetical protein